MNPTRGSRALLLRLGAAVLMFLLAPAARAQSMGDLIRTLGVEALARDYLRPGADAIGYSFNSGLYHSARVDSGLNIWFGLRGVWTYVPESDASFVALLPSSLVALGYPARVTTATVFGGEGAMLHSGQVDPSGNPYPDIALPRGNGLRSTFVMLPHATIGSVAATEIMVRGIPPITFDPEIGKISFVGIGVKHSPTNYLRLPFDIAVMAVAQRLEIGRIMHVSNLNANVHASLPIAIAELYGGFGYESYDIRVAYTYTPTSPDLPAELRTPQSIELDFARVNFRFTLGVTLTFLPLVDVNAEYSFGVQDNFTLGAGLHL